MVHCVGCDARLRRCVAAGGCGSGSPVHLEFREAGRGGICELLYAITHLVYTYGKMSGECNKK